MAQPYRIQVNVDCHDVHAQADWWAETLGWVVEPTDPDFVQKMIHNGYATEDDTETHRGRRVWRGGAAISPPDELTEPTRRRIVLQQVPEAKSVKNRMHVDVVTGGGDIDQVREQLAARGARYVATHSQGPHSWHVMADPEGNEFCISP